MEYLLRRAERADNARIRELYAQMLTAIYGKAATEGYRDEDVAYYYSGGEDLIYVAEIGGSIEAFLAIEAHHDQGSYLYYDDFCVSEAFRGMGIGSAMLDEAEKYCREIGFSTIVLHVERHNVSAQRLYERRGFSVLRVDGSRLCMVKHPV